MGAIPAAELNSRTSFFQTQLVAQGIDGALIVQDLDLYYLSGTTQNCHLYVPSAGEPLLMVRQIWERACADSPLPRKVALKSLQEIPLLLKAQGYPSPRTLGLEFDVIPAQQYLRYQTLFPEVRLVDISPLLREVRMIKTPFEIALIQEAAQRHVNFFSQIPEALQEGKSELTLTRELEFLLREQGHLGPTFSRGLNLGGFLGVVLLSGVNGGVPGKGFSPLGGPGPAAIYSQGGGQKIVQGEEAIIIDAAGCYEGYHIDMTRVYVLGKKLPEVLIKAHGVALEIQAKVLRFAQPGVTCGELYQLALETAAAAGLEKNLGGYQENRVPFIGHGVGLELNDLPIIAENKVALTPGMVFTFEPKFIFPDLGAVGIENTFLVTATGLEKLTNLPEEIFFL